MVYSDHSLQCTEIHYLSSAEQASWPCGRPLLCKRSGEKAWAGRKPNQIVITAMHGCHCEVERTGQYRVLGSCRNEIIAERSIVLLVDDKSGVGPN